jgi:homoserine O-acetyltransferase
MVEPFARPSGLPRPSLSRRFMFQQAAMRLDTEAMPMPWSAPYRDREQPSAGRFASIGVVRLPGGLRMRREGWLPEVEIAYESWGRLSERGDNAVLVFTGLSPSAHAASSPENPLLGWWEYMIGPGRPVDTTRFCVFCVNSLGGCFGSTGPASQSPITGKPHALDFPELCVEDIARAGREALRVLGVERLRAVVGASLGGMSALAYAVQFPSEVENLVVLSAATRATPYAIGVRSLQREMIRSDPEWKRGRYAPGRGPVRGMLLARKLGVTSYRSGREWQERFGRKRVVGQGDYRQPFSLEFEIESYLEHQARKFVGHFDANSYLYLSRAMDWFDLAEHGGSVEAALERIAARSALVIGVETDALFPIWQQQEIAEGLGCQVTCTVLPSPQGHDAFLVDRERFAPVVRDFFERL